MYWSVPQQNYFFKVEKHFVLFPVPCIIATHVPGNIGNSKVC